MKPLEIMAHYIVGSQACTLAYAESEARSIITALEEHGYAIAPYLPSDAMVDAGERTTPALEMTPNCAEIYRAMIAAR